jgi:hypothetical protein
MSSDIQLAINEKEASGNFDSPWFRDIIKCIFRIYICRVKPFTPKDSLFAKEPEFRYKCQGFHISYFTILVIFDITIFFLFRAGLSPLKYIGSFKVWTCIKLSYQYLI